VSFSRREILAMPAFLAAGRDTDAKIEELRTSFEDFLYRAPYKFGGKEVDRVTLLNVHCRLRSRGGKTAEGFASMSMGNVWAFPATSIPYDTTLGAMKSLAGKIGRITSAFTEFAHPLDVNHALEPEYLKAAAEVSREMTLAIPVPKLCTLVTASPVDAAIHDAYGKLHGRNSFNACGKDFVNHDLEHYLGREFRGEYLDRYVQQKSTPRIQMYHSVGASDSLTPAEVTKPIRDGLPENLEDWIPYSGIIAIKIKLNGGNLAADVERVVSIDRVATAAQDKRGVKQWVYCLDFNENCPNVQYLLDFQRQVKQRAPRAFDMVQYIEQPTARDLKANRQNTMFEAAKLRPVVIDESLTDLETLLLAREMGYTGAALKACKGQSQTLLMAAATQKFKMFRCVQDLTCPGAALVHSVGIAAHIPGITGLEANAREYVPAANRGWEKKFPGIFDVRNGYLETRGLDGPGLCTS
jgi:L-alanine-DL-glutamate epimerase-like enolase superfamily enzyme